MVIRRRRMHCDLRTQAKIPGLAGNYNYLSGNGIEEGWQDMSQRMLNVLVPEIVIVCRA